MERVSIRTGWKGVKKMADKKYPKDTTKTVMVKKDGYNSISQVKETEEAWEFQLYNPNIEPSKEESNKENR